LARSKGSLTVSEKYLARRLTGTGPEPPNEKREVRLKSSMVDLSLFAAPILENTFRTE